MGLVDNKVILVTVGAIGMGASDMASYSTGAEFVVDGGVMST